jgi:Ferroportin1 (FPN1)
MVEQRHEQDSSASGGDSRSVDEQTPLVVVSRIVSNVSDGSAANANNDSNNINSNNKISILNYARRLIYVSHAFSQFSEVAWQFSLVLFLAAFTQYKSMILVSTYGMLSWMAVCLFGATAGRFVDGTNRLKAARRFIWCENLAVVMATILCYRLLSLQQLRHNHNNDDTSSHEDYIDGNNESSSSSSWLHGVPTDRHSLLLLLGIHFFGPVAMVLDKGFLVSIERDWVVVLSEQAQSSSNTIKEEGNSSSLLSPLGDDDDAAAAVAVAATNGKDENDGDDDDDVSHRKKHEVTAVQALWLSTTNVVMKQIDLTCQIIGPAMVGFVISAFDSTGGAAPAINNNIHNSSATGSRRISSSSSSSSNASTDLTGAVLLVGLVNIAALVVEYICTARVYHLIPALSIKRQPPVAAPRGASSSSSLTVSPRQSRTLSTKTNGSSNGQDDEQEDEVLSRKPMIIVDATRNSNNDQDDSMVGCGMGQQIRNCCGGGHDRSRGRLWRMEASTSWHGFRRQFLPHGLRIYFKQPIAWGGVALSLLYLNCLTFGGLMTAYLVWKGMRFETVGICRGISSALGLSGTLAYHASVRKTTLVNTGMWSVVLEFICLSLCFASFLVQDYSISVAMLITGVCLSRVGLWVFDITIAQLMQEFIPENVRGVCGGSQQALNAFFMLGSFALGLIFPDPHDFWIYALVGYIAIALAMLFYFFGVFVHASRFLTRAENTSTHLASAPALSI